MDRIDIDRLEEILKPVSSDQMLRRAFRLLMPKKNEWVRYTTSIILSVVLAITLAFVPETVTCTKNAIGVLQAVVLAIFAILFTGYALFQALLGKRMLMSLLKIQNGEQKSKTSKLQELNESFTDSMMIDIFCIILNIIILIVLPIVPEDWLLIPDNLLVNEIIAAILITLYLYTSFTVIFDIKSFICNIVGCFNLFIVAGITEMVEENEVEVVDAIPCNKEMIEYLEKHEDIRRQIRKKMDEDTISKQ